MLLRWSRDAHDTSLRKRLQRRAEMPGTGSGDHLRGLEGDGARIYFRGLGQHLEETGIRFSRPVNALMSFGYGLLVTEFVGSINAVGLDHQLEAGRPSTWPKSCAGNRPLRRGTPEAPPTAAGHFVRTPGGAVYLGDEGRDTVLEAWEAHKATLIPHKILRRPVERWALPTVQATLLARHLRGDLSLYPPFVLP